MRIIQLSFIFIGCLGLIYWFFGLPSNQQSQSTGEPNSALVEIVVPQALSANALIGKSAFDAKCAACHGANAVGQQAVAPPLIHNIYEPSHHGDEAFQRAVAGGVRRHHWNIWTNAPHRRINPRRRKDDCCVCPGIATRERY